MSVDCSAYSACSVPAASGVVCIYDNLLWKTDYYASGYPDDSLYSGAWTFQGSCSSLSSSSDSSGTVVLVVPDSVTARLDAVSANVDILTHTLIPALFLVAFFVGFKIFR